MLCAGVPVCEGLKMTKARPGQWVVISGIGGVGHIAVQYAKAMGRRGTAVHPAAVGQAIGMTRRGGTVVFNGLPPGTFPGPIFDIVVKGLTIRGSIVGTRQDLQEALGFCARGQIHPTVSTRGLDEVNVVFDEMKRARSTVASSSRTDRDGPRCLTPRPGSIGVCAVGSVHKLFPHPCAQSLSGAHSCG